MDLDELCVNTLRMLSVECVEKANSGHPGMPMGAAPMAYVLWSRFLKHNPANPEWPDRDRFVLSAGHGSVMLYSLLHLVGYDLPLNELKSFRQWESKTPGHPEHGLTPGVETSTGPLGQGFANGVGMAIAERFLAARFNRPGHEIVNHFTYAILSDGDLMEGISHEAASLAGHLGLGKLVYLYDDNHISIEGSTNLTFTENRATRFAAYGWHVQQVADGNSLMAIESAILSALRETRRPSLIAVRTCIGYGCPNKQDTAAAHGEPLGAEEMRLTKEKLGWPKEPEFFIPDEALTCFRQATDKGKEREERWKNLLRSYEKTFPDLAREWHSWMQGELPEGWKRDLPVFAPNAKGLATRAVSGAVLNAVAPRLKNLVGGSADLAPSNKTLIEEEGDFLADHYDRRNLHFGVREHGMGGVLNGMALHGGLIPYGGTFLVFSDYMRPAIRLASLMNLKVVYVFTHDSIGLGEDGPTHQPVEHLATLRAIPNLTVVRPCDAAETVEAWCLALEQKKGPFALALTRQAVPVLDRASFASEKGLRKGAYILSEPEEGNPDIVLVGSGSEVHLALEASKRLREKGICSRVVSMPSWELFDAQPEEYRSQVLPKQSHPLLAVEAGIAQGWHRYVGEKGDVVSLDRFGASAPYKTLYDKFGLTAERVAERALKLLGRS